MRPHFIAVVFLFSAASAIGCRDFLTDETSITTALSSRQFSVTSGIQFEIAPGESALVDDSDLVIHFVNVSSDNRCPGPARCNFRGVARVELELESLEEKSTLDLEIPGLVGVPYGEAEGVRHQGYVFRLLALFPHPVSGSPAELSAYRSMLLVEREDAVAAPDPSG